MSRAPDPVCPPKRTRRSFIDLILGFGFIGTATSVVYPVLRYLKPLGPSGAQGPIKLSKEEQGRLEKA